MPEKSGPGTADLPHGARLDSSPQSLDLPEDFEANRERYELWCIQVPIEFDASREFRTRKLDFAAQGNTANSKLSCFLPLKNDNSTSTEHQKPKQALLEMQNTEFANMRILLKSNLSANVEESKEAEFKPVLKFSRGFRLVEDEHIVEDLFLKSNLALDSELAPSRVKVDGRSIDTKGYKWRMGYTNVPQAKNLKRKFTHPGSSGPGLKSKISETPISEKTSKTKERPESSTKKRKHNKKKDRSDD